MIKMVLSGKVVPKARPRFTSKGPAHLPPNYAKWKKGAVTALKSLGCGPFEGVALRVTFVNALRANSDCDNAVGAIMDALVSGKILKGDTVQDVRSLSVENYSSKGEIAPQTLIEIDKDWGVDIERIGKVLFEFLDKFEDHIINCPVMINLFRYVVIREEFVLYV